MNGVQNKKVLVTGTSRGIGRAIAQEFARNGAHVFGTATSESSHSEFEGFVLPISQRGRESNNVLNLSERFNQTS